jgi:hypothetical protein
MIRCESRRKLRLFVDIMLKSPKRGWFAAVHNAYLVNRATIDAEPFYRAIQSYTENVCQAKDADMIRWPRM